MPQKLVYSKWNFNKMYNNFSNRCQISNSSIKILVKKAGLSSILEPKIAINSRRLSKSEGNKFCMDVVHCSPKFLDWFAPMLVCSLHSPHFVQVDPHGFLQDPEIPQFILFFQHLQMCCYVLPLETLDFFSVLSAFTVD